MLEMLRHADLNTEQVEPAPLLAALVIQTCAGAAVLAAAGLLSIDGMTALWPWLAGVLAAAIGRVAGLPSWWIPINLLLPPAAAFLLDAALPASAYLAAFVALWLANSAAWRGRVPLFLSGRAAIDALLPLLPEKANFRMLDAGCGTGSVVVPLARARPDGHYHGIELAPLPFVVSWCRARCVARAPAIRWGDFWGADFSRYDIVYAYLSPAAMAKLWRKAQLEMRPGTLLVSNSFAVPGVAPSQTVQYAARGTLYAWRM